jgi:CheY-like chemotaxis protein
MLLDEIQPRLDLRTVLVVDDEPLITMMLEDMLADMGVEKVIVASDLTSAQQMLDTPVDCVILDVRIRGGESYSFAELLIERGIPVLFSTGMNPDAMAERFRNTPTLAKPFSESDLRAGLLLATKRTCRSVDDDR